jgi:hypothetical protein
MRGFQSAALLALGVMIQLPLPAPIFSPPNSSQRIKQADAIVVARIASGTSTASGPQISTDLTLHVERTLKGELIAGTDVAAHLEGRGYFNVPDVRQTQLSASFYGIWFLNTKARPYTVISRDDNSGELIWAVVALPEAAPAGKPGDTPAASVANELASAIRWTAASNNKESPGQLLMLLENFKSLDPAVTLSIYKDFAKDPLPRLRAVGIQGLVAANDPAGVKQALAEWSELSAAGDVNPIINSLMMYSNASDSEAVRALGELAQRDHPQQGLRENAVYALRAIHSKDALPALAALLDQPSERVRPYAISGFCLFVRNAPVVTPQSIPSMSWLQTRPPTPLLNPETEHYCLLGGTRGTSGDLDEYASFWKSWWAAHRLEIEGR